MLSSILREKTAIYGFCFCFSFFLFFLRGFCRREFVSILGPIHFSCSFSFCYFCFYCFVYVFLVLFFFYYSSVWLPALLLFARYLWGNKPTTFFFFSACRFKGRDVKDLVTRIQQTVATVVGLNWNRTWARMACDLRGCSLAAPPSPPPSIPRSAVSQTRKCNSCHACVTATSSLCSHACQETDKVDYCFAQSFLPPPIVVVFWDSFFKNQNPSFVPRNFVNSWSNSPDLLMT